MYNVCMATLIMLRMLSLKQTFPNLKADQINEKAESQKKVIP
jgi:hypothetical protein